MAIAIKTASGARVVTLPKPKSNAGRKATHGTDAFQRVLDAIAKGQSISEACKQPNTPSVTVFNRWRKADARNEAAFKQALSDQSHDLVDSVFLRLDRYKELKLPPQVRVSIDRIYTQHVQWLASRRNPRDYSAAVAGESDNVITVVNGLPAGSKKGGADAED